MRQITSLEKDMRQIEREERRNSPIIAYLPPDKTYEEKQWRESVEKYLRTFDLIAIPIGILKNCKNEQ
jgi:hypothetical protein